MARPEVADVIREFGTDYLRHHGANVCAQQRRVLRDLAHCRTAALGSHRRRCDGCGHEEVSYNSCRNRHCPKCQSTKQREWLARESASLLEVEYFHVVFTLPDALCALALGNPRAMYGILFESAADALTTIGKDPRHLGVTIGCTAVLHTWGQNLDYHPHVHCVVPGGGISPEGRWVPCRAGFFLPVRVLSRRFRETFLRRLQQALDTGHVIATEPVCFGTLREHEWVVYAKPPFGGPQQVLRYLAKYTHRVAISNRRLIAIVGAQVRFRWKDYRSSRHRTMVLTGIEFLRRFLLHVLPLGFVRIRHFGFLANSVREARLQQIRPQLTPPIPEAILDRVDIPEPALGAVDDFDPICPHCKKGRLRVLAIEDAPQLQPG